MPGEKRRRQAKRGRAGSGPVSGYLPGAGDREVSGTVCSGSSSATQPVIDQAPDVGECAEMSGRRMRRAREPHRPRMMRFLRHRILRELVCRASCVGPTSHSPYKSILFMVKRPGPRAKRSSRSHQSILLAWTRPGRAYPHRLGLHQGFWMGTHGVSRTSRMGCPLSGIGSASLGK